jgi:hypothetical protein
MDHPQITQPERVPAIACFITYPLGFIQDKDGLNNSIDQVLVKKPPFLFVSKLEGLSFSIRIRILFIVRSLVWPGVLFLKVH